MADCLETLVGLTDIDCECYSDLQPEGWNESESGRYLTDPDVGFPTLDAVFQSVDCGNEFWRMLTKARTDAIRDFRHELQVRMKQHNSPRLQTWRGLIGETNYRFRLSPTETYIGLLFRFPFWRGASFVLNRIGLNISVADTVTVHIISNDPAFVPREFEITTVANQTTFVNIPEGQPLSFNFYSENTEKLVYAIYYTLPSGATTNENKVSCGCTPNDPIKKGTFLAGGFAKNDLEELYQITPGTTAYGLSIGGYLDCDYTGFLCDLKEFSAQDLLDDAAAAIQAAGAAKLISMVIETGKINRYTLKPLEELYGRRTRLQNNFSEYVDGLSQNYRPELSGCWVCNARKTWQRRAIPI